LHHQSTRLALPGGCPRDSIEVRLYRAGLCDEQACATSGHDVRVYQHACTRPLRLVIGKTQLRRRWRTAV
jgi:hypothetical protein